MTLINHAANNLRQLNRVIEGLSDTSYVTPIVALSYASIGAHVRHTLEFYKCLQASSPREVCYDARRRDHALESDRQAAIEAIQSTIHWLKEELSGDRSLEIKVDYSAKGNQSQTLTTSLFRELAFCLEHSIHHQALIKVALREISDPDQINEEFGVAPSTLRAANASLGT
jgi:uncharacterized damage-inducible protein DinB